MALLLSLLMSLSAQADVFSTLPVNFYFQEQPPEEGQVTIGGNAIFNLVLEYDIHPCNGQKLESATARRDTDEKGNTIYWISLKIYSPNPMTTMWCKTTERVTIENVNKANLDVNTKLYFEVDAPYVGLQKK